MRVFQSIKTLPSPSGDCRWMILDGALLPELEKNVAQIGIESSCHIECVSLLRGSAWEAVADIGPFFVPWSKALENWVLATASFCPGVIFDSDASPSDIEQHWRKLVHSQPIGLENSLSRLYDPIVFHCLLRRTHDLRLSTWLGPIKTAWCFDRFQEVIWEISSLLPLTKNNDVQSIMFTDEEWQGLGDASLMSTAWRLTPHLEAYFPTKAQSNKVHTYELIYQELIKLKRLGSVDEQLATYYLNIFGRLGRVLDDNTLYPDITACLNDKGMTLLERLTQVNQMSLLLTQKS